MSRAPTPSSLRFGWALGVVVLAGCRAAPPEERKPDEAKPAKVTCVAVTSGELARLVVLRGRVATRPGGDLPVASLVAGKILEVKVEEGARVKPGTVVAIVDDLGPRAAVGEARAALARAKSAAAEADAALARAKTLHAAGLISKADLDAAAAKAEAAAADVAAQEAASGLASGTLGRVEVRSTFEGLVTKVFRGPGAVVDGTATTPIVEVAADARLEIVAEATEPELALVAEGDPAEADLQGHVVRGSVYALARTLDPKTGLGTARIAVDPSTEASSLRIGAFGKVRVTAKPLPSVLSIPRAALRGAVLDGADVAKCVDHKIALAHVRVGYRDEVRVEVLSGLEKGDRVAIGDVLGLSEGTPVEEGDGAASASPAPQTSAAPASPVSASPRPSSSAPSGEDGP